MKTERIKENMQIWDFFAAFYFILYFFDSFENEITKLSKIINEISM